MLLKSTVWCQYLLSRSRRLTKPRATSYSARSTWDRVVELDLPAIIPSARPVYESEDGVLVVRTDISNVE